MGIERLLLTLEQKGIKNLKSKRSESISKVVYVKILRIN
ncbi:hypothetical protein CDSM653_01119 [Caldanaerobacter subterraneus subsp. pacificus DSM 12653]|uniref:Uncharacterized protein n=1 Tax=Caldanaerobacter subterraneus subsp. pacificus DSM 12653 TaxID=391606 RepID=A0A0F5PMQ2_9THEO|nr:hypothetical protein CDSM653_01119 [Caldanaerobacter subterraneus subsp. pacificus DSM 12653]